MKTILAFLFALVAAAAASSATSYEKVDLGAAFTSRMVAEALTGVRADCSGLCVIHYGATHRCGVGAIRNPCNGDESAVGGQSEEGCSCCVRKS